MTTKDKIKEFILSIRIINTHSHHKARNTLCNGTYNLDVILRNSYVSWSGVEFTQSHKSREHYLDVVRYKSYFKAIEAAISTLYDLPERITADNWDDFNHVIEQKNHEAPLFDKLRDECSYEYIIVDAYWNPGLNWGRSDLFTPAFRVNAFLNGYDRDYLDMDKMGIESVLSESPKTLNDYVNAMRQVISAKINEGCVALKTANAYERGLDYYKTTKEKAEKVFLCNHGQWTKEDIIHFQNYIFYSICDLAADLDVPVQVHTGLGCMKKTNALQMVDVIGDHPKTKFVLFHGGYPWTQDIGGMLHFFQNVYSDICWLPILSPTVATGALNEMMEIGTSDKILWGCDTITFEESYGARETMAEVLANALSSKVDSGYYSMTEAEKIVRNILFNNPKTLYKFE